MQTSIGLPELVLVPPCDFSVRMHKHWTETLNMPAPPALMDVQRLMAEEFQHLIINNSTDTAVSSSVVLPLPTGAGKTQGTCVYASMQAELNALTADSGLPVGIVIITRLIEDADGIAKQINELSGRTVAVAHHTKNKADAVDVFNSDVLVICHQAFLNAAKGWRVHDGERWHRISQWRGGDRLLFVIDEALANVVDSNEATVKNLAMAVQSIPHELRLRFPVAIKILEDMKRWLEAKETGTDDSTKLLWGEGSESISQQLRVLREALSGVDFDPSLYKEDAQSRVGDILQDVEAMLASFGYYFKSGDQHSINSATYLLPPGLPGVVVLDATAENDTLYQLLGPRVRIVDVPPNVRDYSNVTLHVARTASGLGKDVSGKAKHLRLPRLAKHLAAEIAPGRSVFLCVHMHSEALAETFSTAELKLKVGHWHAIDGKNTWKDCDVAVIFGLPYMDQRRAINTLFATHGPQDTAWLQANTNKQQANLLTVIMQRHLATSIVQAINRICCRRVIDEQGRCPVADVYILLPKHWQGDAILSDIQGNMPGINVVPWDYEPDGPKVYAPRSSSASAAIISLMRQQGAGMTPFPFIQQQLSLTKRQVSRIKEQRKREADAVQIL
jgi:hypothetical protein